MSRAGPSDPAAEVRRRASLLVSAGRAREAIAILERALASAPEDPAMLCELALAYLHAGERARQLEVANRAAAANPESEWAQRLRCDALGALGRHQEGLEAARRAVALAPREPLALLCLVKALRATKDRPAARARAEELVALAPQKASSHETWALVALDDGRLIESEAGMRRALALEPEAATYHNNLGLVLLRQRRNEEALAAFEQAARIDPTLQIAQQNLAIGLRNHLSFNLRDWVSHLIPAELPLSRRLAALVVVGLIAAGFFFAQQRAPEAVSATVLVTLVGSMAVVTRRRLRRLSPTLRRFAASRRAVPRQSLANPVVRAIIVAPVLLFAALAVAVAVTDPKMRGHSWKRALTVTGAAAGLFGSWRFARRRPSDWRAG